MCIRARTPSISPLTLDEQIDQYILNTRRESGKKTEVSVLRTWQVSWITTRSLFTIAHRAVQRWLTGAIMAGTVPDGIIDAQHTMEYLKYSATRALLTRKGSESSGGRQLTAVRQRAHLINSKLTVVYTDSHHSRRSPSCLAGYGDGRRKTTHRWYLSAQRNRLVSRTSTSLYRSKLNVDALSKCISARCPLPACI